jgi:starvation-inducible DNA-binding protein
VRTHVTAFDLLKANDALAALCEGRFAGPAVLLCGPGAFPSATRRMSESTDPNDRPAVVSISTSQETTPMEQKMKIDIGIEANKRHEIAAGLSRVLADTYTLYLKTHNFHWNVTGPMFQTLHLMFEAQYNELALAVDLVAERIRALGVAAPGTYKKFVELSAIQEEEDVPKAESMIRRLVEGHETVARTAREVFRAAEGASDQPTCDLLTQRMQVHEKAAWMLRSLLE